MSQSVMLPAQSKTALCKSGQKSEESEVDDPLIDERPSRVDGSRIDSGQL